jgi:hypothetical protein
VQLLHLSESLATLSPVAVRRLTADCGVAMHTLFTAAFAGLPAGPARTAAEAAGAALAAASEDNGDFARVVAAQAADYERLFAQQQQQQQQQGVAAPIAQIGAQAAAIAWNAGGAATQVWGALAARAAFAQPGAAAVASLAPQVAGAPTVVVEDGDEDGNDGDDQGDAAMDGSNSKSGKSKSKGAGSAKGGKGSSSAKGAAPRVPTALAASTAEADAHPDWIEWTNRSEAQLLALQTLANIVAAVVAVAAENAAEDSDDEDPSRAAAGAADLPVPIEAITALLPSVLAIVLSADADADAAAALAVSDPGRSEDGAPTHASLALPHMIRSAAVALLSNAMPLVEPRGEPWTNGAVWQCTLLALCRAVLARKQRPAAAAASALSAPSTVNDDAAEVARGLANLLVCVLKRAADEDAKVALAVAPGAPSEVHEALAAMASGSWPREARATALSALGLLGRHLDALTLPWAEQDMLRDATALAVALRVEDPFLSCTAADAVMDAFAEPRGNTVIKRVNLLPSLETYAARASSFANDIERLGDDADEEDIELRASLLDVVVNIRRFREYKAEQ